MSEIRVVTRAKVSSLWGWGFFCCVERSP